MAPNMKLGLLSGTSSSNRSKEDTRKLYKKLT